MTTARWHISREGNVLVLSRRNPARLDVSATTTFPDMRRGRLAHQIRQDLWRELQNLRGFVPVVRVTRIDDGLLVEAGGALACPAPPDTQSRIADLLARPANRARWQARAGRR